MESQYLHFFEFRDTGKTKTWHILSKSSGLILGRIKWYGPWRQYCFFPAVNTIWNRTCMTDVNTFISEEMNKRKIPNSIQ